MPQMSNATPVLNGFLFQDCTAIVLLFDNIKNIQSFRVEGEREDVEFKLTDGSYVFVQSKYCKKERQRMDAISILTKALKSLSSADTRDCHRLVYATNIIMPLGSKTPLEDFGPHDHTIDYSDLTPESKEIINNILQSSGQLLDCSKLTFRIIAFNDSDLGRYNSTIYQSLNHFLSSLGNSFHINDVEIFNLLLDVIKHNENNRDLSKYITKENVVWIIVEKLMSSVGPYFDQLDPALCHEVECKYGEIISIYTEKISYASKILYDYNIWSKDLPKTANTTQKFIQDNWQQYTSEFDTGNVDFETLKALTVIILNKILALRYVVKDLKEASGLVD